MSQSSDTQKVDDIELAEAILFMTLLYCSLYCTVVCEIHVCVYSVGHLQLCALIFLKDSIHYLH